jgi:hypothetical protein
MYSVTKERERASVNDRSRDLSGLQKRKWWITMALAKRGTGSEDGLSSSASSPFLLYNRHCFEYNLKWEGGAKHRGNTFKSHLG